MGLLAWARLLAAEGPGRAWVLLVLIVDRAAGLLLMIPLCVVTGPGWLS